jgi:hypothetical protein
VTLRVQYTATPPLTLMGSWAPCAAHQTRSQLPHGPWHAALAYHEATTSEGSPRGMRLHVDVHGRRDYAAGLDVDHSDCDIGTAALEHYEGTASAEGEVQWATGRPYSDRGSSPRVYPPGLSRRLCRLVAEGLADMFQRWRPLGADVEFRVNEVRCREPHWRRYQLVSPRLEARRS